jgi:hypothetical protein
MKQAFPDALLTSNPLRQPKQMCGTLPEPIPLARHACPSQAVVLLQNLVQHCLPVTMLAAFEASAVAATTPAAFAAPAACMQESITLEPAQYLCNKSPHGCKRPCATALMITQHLSE